MLVLGVHYGHGAAAALVGGGRVLAAVEEEKLNRVKGYVGFPFMAVEFVLAQGGVSLEDVDQVAVGTVDVGEFSSNFAHLARVIFQDRRAWVRAVAYAADLTQRVFSRWNSTAALERVFRHYLATKARIPPDKLVKVDHHLAHAASAFYAGPWREAIVLTADGKGDGACGGAYRGDGEGVHRVDRVHQRFSVGQFYQAVTKHLGYRVNRHEGKITGLAAYGEHDRSLPLLRGVLGVGPSGDFYNEFYRQPGLAADPVGFYRNKVGRKDYISGKYLRLLNAELRPFAIVHQLYQNFLATEAADMAPADLAAGIQALAEELMEAYARRHLTDDSPNEVCLAGGVFANVKVNQRLREIAGVEGLYVQPAMDDAGCALGAAFQAVVAREGVAALARPAMTTVYLGPGYAEERLEQALRAAGVAYDRPADPAQWIADQLHAGRIVGRFDGRLEWGPRSLGNRSILARPTDRSLNDTLNERLCRTEFMPFAPSILAEAAGDYLVGYREGDVAARYMTATYAVAPAKTADIAAGVHIDGTARPQVVFRDDNPGFYAVIEAYRALSGIPAVINTSFNMHEEPIVNSPEDALRAFAAGAVDALAIGPFAVGGDA